MDIPSKNLCGKCFKSLNKDIIACHTCKAKYHFICANIDIKLVEVFNDNKNVVYNCNGCLNITSNLLLHISSMSHDLRELNHLVNSSVVQGLREIKQQLVDLTQNKQKSQLPKKKQQKKNSNYLHNEHNLDNEVLVTKPTTSAQAVSNTINGHQFLSAASSFSSIPTVASNVTNNDANMFDDNTQPLQNANGWVNVQKRRRRRGPVVMGVNDSEDLDVIIQKKWIHISSFKSTMQCEKIIEYVSKTTEIGKQHMECYKLVKKDVDVNELKRVNFKLGISPCFYNEIIDPKTWPSGIRVRPFVNFPKKDVRMEQN